MSKWHYCLIVAIIAYAVGAMYPGPLNWIKAKLQG